MKADFGVDTQVQNCWAQNMASGSIAEYGSMSFQRDCTNSQFPCICESTHVPQPQPLLMSNLKVATKTMGVKWHFSVSICNFLQRSNVK